MSEGQKKEKRRKTKIKISSLLVVLSCICFILASFPLWFDKPYSPAYRLICGSNLVSLSRAMILYTADNEGIFTTPSKWCDLLIEHGNVTKKHFECRGAEKGPCNYAMNRNLENIGRLDKTNIHPDIVLLFETGPGWNQVGSSEILTTANHEDKGCNVLFLDGHVTFVLKKDLHKLKWKPDEAQPE